MRELERDRGEEGRGLTWRAETVASIEWCVSSNALRRYIKTFGPTARGACQSTKSFADT
jgi:hypothetical protein